LKYISLGWSYCSDVYGRRVVLVTPASDSPRDGVDDGAGAGGGQKLTFTRAAALSVGWAQLLAFFHISI